MKKKGRFHNVLKKLGGPSTSTEIQTRSELAFESVQHIINIHGENSFDGCELRLNPEKFIGLSIGDIISLTSSTKENSIVYQVNQATLNGGLKAKSTISLLKGLAEYWGFKEEEIVQIKLLSAENTGNFHLDRCELLIKNQFINRRDAFFILEALQGKAVFTGQKIDVGKNEFKIKNLVKKEALSNSGIIANDTNVTFRSLSGKLMICIEISRELFEIDNSELLLERLRNVLIKTFYRLDTFSSAHQISILLYARVFYLKYSSINDLLNDLIIKHTELGNNEDDSQVPFIKEGIGGYQITERGEIYKDFYKVLPIGDTKKTRSFTVGRIIKAILKFVSYLNCNNIKNLIEAKIDGKIEKKKNPDLLLPRKPKKSKTLLSPQKNVDARTKKLKKTKSRDFFFQEKTSRFLNFMQGELSTSCKSNLLEAISVVGKIYGIHYQQKNLKSCLQNILVITSGSGFYLSDSYLYDAVKKILQLTKIWCAVINLKPKSSILAPMLLVPSINQNSIVDDTFVDDNCNEHLFENCLGKSLEQNHLFVSINSAKMKSNNFQVFEKNFKNILKSNETNLIKVQNEDLYLHGISEEALSILQCKHTWHYIVDEKKRHGKIFQKNPYKKKHPNWLHFIFYDELIEDGIFYLYSNVKAVPNDPNCVSMAIINSLKIYNEINYVCEIEKEVVKGEGFYKNKTFAESIEEEFLSFEVASTNFNQIDSKFFACQNTLEFDHFLDNIKNKQNNQSNQYVVNEKTSAQIKNTLFDYITIVDSKNFVKQSSKFSASNYYNRWSHIDTPTKGECQLANFKDEIKNKINSNKKEELMEMNKMLDTEYFWKNIIEIPMLPLFINSESEIHVKGKTHTFYVENNAEEYLKEVVSQRLAQDFQIVKNNKIEGNIFKQKTFCLELGYAQTNITLENENIRVIENSQIKKFSFREKTIEIMKNSCTPVYYECMLFDNKLKCFVKKNIGLNLLNFINWNDYDKILADVLIPEKINHTMLSNMKALNVSFGLFESGKVESFSRNKTGYTNKYDSFIKLINALKEKLNSIHGVEYAIDVKFIQKRKEIKQIDEKNKKIRIIVTSPMFLKTTKEFFILEYDAYFCPKTTYKFSFYWWSCFGSTLNELFNFLSVKSSQLNFILKDLFYEKFQKISPLKSNLEFPQKNKNVVLWLKKTCFLLDFIFDQKIPDEEEEDFSLFIHLNCSCVLLISETRIQFKDTSNVFDSDGENKMIAETFYKLNLNIFCLEIIDKIFEESMQLIFAPKILISEDKKISMTT